MAIELRIVSTIIAQWPEWLGWSIRGLPVVSTASISFLATCQNLTLVELRDLYDARSLSVVIRVKSHSTHLLGCGNVICILVVSQPDETRETKTDSLVTLKTLGRFVDPVQRQSLKAAMENIDPAGGLTGSDSGRRIRPPSRPSVRTRRRAASRDPPRHLLFSRSAREASKAHEAL